LYAGLWDKWVGDEIFRASLINRLPEQERATLLAEYPTNLQNPKPAELPPKIPIQEGPSWLQKTVNFSKAVVTHIAHGLPVTPTEEQERRLAICLACLPPEGYYDVETGTCLHKNCGCKLTRKVSFLMEKCPLDPPKW